MAIRDEWTPLDGQNDGVDQFKAYIDEPQAQVPLEQSPIPYWISKLTVWPQLAKMALDIYSTPACSDDPERVFSEGGGCFLYHDDDNSQVTTCSRSYAYGIGKGVAL
jgi:hypothetical protein